MSHNEFLERNGITPRKQKTHDEFMYALVVSPVINSVEGLINNYNKISIPDYSKYGDYSSTGINYLNVSLQADEVIKSLSQLKGKISDEEYKKLQDTVNDIKWYSEKNRMNIQRVNDFYSSFENEDQYKAWETDNRLYAEHGDLTAENVDYYIRTMEKRKQNGELNGYEEEFYNWIKNYDLTYGYKNEEYYKQRINMLEDERKVLVEATHKNIGSNGYDYIEDKAKAQAEIDRQLEFIGGRIGDMTYLRNLYTIENVFDEKGYNQYLNVEDFDANYQKGKAVEDENKSNQGTTFLKVLWDRMTGNHFDGVSVEELPMSSVMGKYLTDDEKKVYYYLLGNEEKVEEFKTYYEDMLYLANQRWNEDMSKGIAEIMNFDSAGGAVATIGLNLLSAPANVLGGGVSLTSAMIDILDGDKIDTNGAGFFLTNFAQSVRGSTNKMIDSAGWNLVYNAVMSSADSLFAAGVFGKAAPFILAGSAAASRMKELVNQGASDFEIITGSLASGVIEVITEKVSIDRLFGGEIKPTSFKQFIKEGLTQAFVEGSEEIASEVLNNLSDEILRGSMSDYNQSIRRYQAEGLSKSEAQKKAANDVLVQIMEAALSGMISGGIGGTVAGGSQMHKFNVIGTNIVKGNNVDTVLTAAEYLGDLNPEIKGQVTALKNHTKTGKSGKVNTVYKRMLGKVAATVAQNAADVKQNVTEKAISNELKSRGVNLKVIDKVSKIAGKFLSGQKLSSAEQGYLQHNSVASTVMHEIEAAQEQVKAETLPQSPTATAPSTDGTNVQSSAPQWAVDLVKKLATIDSAVNIVKLSASGKSAQNTHNSEVNRMIKILSIASGKTTAEQEAEAGDIPYSQYIKEKEAAEKEASEKQNTAENGGDTSPMENVDGENSREKILNVFGITKLNDTLHVQKQVLETLEIKGFWQNKEKHSTTVVNTESGMEIEINKKGIKETFNFDNFTKTPAQVKLRKLKTVLHIPEIIEKGSMRKNAENYHDENSSIVYSYIDQTVNVDGDEFTVTIAVRVSAQKNKFWVHQIDIKKGTVSPPAGTSESSKTGYTTYDTKDSIKENVLYVKNDFMNSQESQEGEDDFTGFNEPDVSEDGVTYESRLLHTMRGEKITTEGQAYIKKICKNLGVEVVFENVLTPKGKHADGYIDSNGVIHIDFHCSNPVEFVLKHELTHYGESSALYSDFCKAVISSEAFAQWIDGKVDGDSSATVKAAEYREQISSLYAKNGVKLSPAKQQSEMIANFVGEVLFSKDTNGLERLTANMPIKQKRSVIDFIKDFIAHIKEKLTKVNGVSSEILSLERKFNKLLSTAEQNKTAEEGGSYSIAEDVNGYYVKIDTSQELFDGKSIQEQQDIAKKVIKNNFKGKVLNVGKEGSAYVNKKSAEEYAYPANRRMDTIVKESKMRAAPELDNLLSVSQFVENRSDDGRHPDATGGWDTYITRFEVGGVMFKGEVKIKVTDRGYVFYDITQIEKLPVNGGQTVVNTAAASGSPSTDIIDDNSPDVNSNYMQEAENNSTDTEENVSENAETDISESFSIPNETAEKNNSSEAAGGNKYSYNALVSKPDMQITTVDDSVEYTPNAENRKNVVNEAVKNAASVGRINENGNAVVYVEDIDTEIIVPKRSMVHGLDRRFGVQAPVLVKIGEILKNSIQINELVPRSFDADKTYALISTANGDKGLYIISFIVNKFSNEVAQIDVLYSVNTKKESAALLPKFTDKSAPPTDSTISISDLLDLVNKYFPDILPEDVLRYYGYTSRPDGEIGKSALYSIEMEAERKTDITDIPDLMAEISAKHKNGELTDEEYRVEVQDLLLRANEKYGSIEQGEKAENKTQIPKRVTSNKSEKTKRWVRTVHESGILPEDMEVELDAQILKDAMSYQIIGDKAAQTQANAAIQRGTAQKEWEAAVNGEGQVGKREIAIGETLLKLAAERKDEKSVMKLIAEVSEMGTRAGQVVQAMSMLKKMDGIGQLYYVQKCVERINRDLDKRFARKLKKGKLDIIPQVKINETLANQLAASKTAEDFDVTYEAMMQSIAEQVPTTFLDKWNAWRYFAMLFNSRTHIRNFGGNLGFLPTVRFKDLLAASMEKIFLGEEKRTKSVVVKKEYQKFAEEDYPEIEAIITGGGKMNPSDEIRDRQNVFDTKWLEKLRKWNFDLLEKEDAYFLKKHYAHALGGFLQARNINITKEIDSAVMEEARKYAMVEAQKATYRDASKAAEAISKFTSKGGFWGNFVEGVLPFKKTPINIVKRGIEYSPIGLIKTLTKGTIDLKNEKISASQYIDGIAGGLTGTGIVILGMLLSSLGFIKITGGFDGDEEDDLNRLLGRQEYAVEIGGVSYTIDWMAPVCIPFFMGVEIQNALEEEGNGNLWQSFKNVAGNALEPIINLSMLSGMQDVISSAKYSEGSAVVGSVFWNIILSYSSQALPTIGGSVARTIDGTRRTTYIDKTSWMSDMGQMALNKIESKIPGVSMLRSEYVDEFGRTEDSGNVFGRAIQNFVSPGYYSKIEDDPVIEELKDLYEKTGEGVLPSKPKKYIEVGGEKIHLTAEEYEEYAKEVGQDRYDYVREFMNSSMYRTLSDAEKIKVITDLYSYAQAKAKTHYSEYELQKTYKKVYENEKNGMSPVVYYSSSHLTNRDEYDTNGNGTVTKNERLAAIRKMNVSNDIKAALIALYS